VQTRIKFASRTRQTSAKQPQLIVVTSINVIEVRRNLSFESNWLIAVNDEKTSNTATEEPAPETHFLPERRARYNEIDAQQINTHNTPIEIEKGLQI